MCIRDSYIGLRETRMGAIERAKQVWPELNGQKVSSTTHILVKFVFTMEGVAHYTVTNAGPAFHYASVLRKITFGDVCEDWGTWHFAGPLQLHDIGARGELLIKAEREELSAAMLAAVDEMLAARRRS